MTAIKTGCAVCIHYDQINGPLPECKTCKEYSNFSFAQRPVPSPALSTQVGGSHYKHMPIQPIEYSMLNHLDPCQHTIIKYVSRFREKGGIEDLQKAKHVIDMLIEFEGRMK